MSAETEFQAVLRAHAPLMALLGGAAERIAQNAVADHVGAPCIVYGTTRVPDLHLSNSAGATNVQFAVQCWAATAAAAAALADAMQAALLAEGVACTQRASAYDAELGLDGEEVTVDWWET